jgi:hypothetical protein
MKMRPRIYYTETDKALMWDRWQKGESLSLSWWNKGNRILILSILYNP